MSRSSSIQNKKELRILLGENAIVFYSIRMSAFLPNFFFKIDQFIKLYTTIIRVTIGKILLHLSVNHASEHDK